MIKTILFLVLVLQAFSGQGSEGRRVRLNVNDELVLPTFTSTDTPGMLSFKFHHLQEMMQQFLSQFN